MQFEHGQPDQQRGALAVMAVVEQCEDRFMQQA
jgi:hypothetical protein